MPTSMTQDNQTYYLHYDQVGTLKLITDANHNIIKEITYDTFGNILNDTNTDLEIPFGFAGGMHDRDTELVHFGYREYDPYTGKWTAKDPIGFDGGDFNLYGYVSSDPINFIDPMGEAEIPWYISNSKVILLVRDRAKAFNLNLDECSDENVLDFVASLPQDEAEKFNAMWEKLPSPPKSGWSPKDIELNKDISKQLNNMLQNWVNNSNCKNCVK